MQEHESQVAPDPDYQLALLRGSVKAASAGHKSADLWKMPIDDFYEIPGFNVRIQGPAYDARVRALADSIKTEGFHVNKPLAVFPMRLGDKSVFAVYDGYTRLKAAKLARSEGAHIEVLPCVSAPEGTSMEDLTVALYTDNNGTQLGPYELGILCKRMVGFGWDAEAIAKRLNIGEKYVHDLLLLVSAPKVIRDLVVAGKVSPNTAIAIVRKHGAQAPSILQAMVSRAESEGKATATAKHEPGARLRSAVRKSASTMAETLRGIREDRAYESLNDELRKKIEGLLLQLDAAQSDDCTPSAAVDPA